MRLILALAIFSSSCAHAKAKPVPVKVQPTPKLVLPEVVDGEDAAEVMAAKVAVEVARLKWIGVLDRFERKYGIKFDTGDGWDEVDGRLKVRRLPKGDGK